MRKTKELAAAVKTGIVTDRNFHHAEAGVPAPADATPRVETMVIPTAAFLWLMGIGPADEGHQFGDGLIEKPKAPTFWWRSIFKRRCKV